MKIQNPQAVTAGIDPLYARKGDQPAPRPTDKQAKSADGDALDLSLSARVSELSSHMAAGLADPPAGLTPERLGQIQNRIDSGFYTHAETAAVTAGQILEFYGR